jgi:hypothetical protein
MMSASQPARVFDRADVAPSFRQIIARRLDGQYALDAFGADPEIQDVLAPVASMFVRVNVVGAEHLPRTGGATLVSNRGFGLIEPIVLTLAVRNAVQRRVRIEGAVPMPILRDVSYKVGALGYHPDDVRAALREGYLVGIPLSPTWFRTGAGSPPREVMIACTGSPMIPVGIRPGGPFGTSLRPWQVVVGEPILLPDSAGTGDPLAAAELGDRIRRAVRGLLS